LSFNEQLSNIKSLTYITDIIPKCKCTLQIGLILTQLILGERVLYPSKDKPRGEGQDECKFFKSHRSYISVLLRTSKPTACDRKLSEHRCLFFFFS
jgi:hypothetical protein